MVDFNQFRPQTANDPNYEGAARRYTDADVPDSAGDAARANSKRLIAGIGEGLESAVNTGYEAVKTSIKDMVQEGTDELRDAQGVRDAVFDTENQASIATGGKPAEPEAVKSSISRLHAAFQQGKISDTNYYAQLETMTRSIRSRFPGFRDEVDAMVQHVTGVTPANALRTSILHELAKGEETRDAKEKDFRHFETNKAKYLPPDYYDRKQSGKPYSQEETYAYVGKQEQAEHKVETDKAILERDAAQGRMDDNKAESVAREGVSALNHRVLEEAKPLLDDILKLKLSGKAPTPEQLTYINTKFLELRGKAQVAFNEYMDKPLTPNSGRTMGSLVKDKREGMLKDTMSIFDNVEKAIADKDVGLLNTVATSIKARSEATQLQLHEKYNTLGMLGELSKMVGPAGGEVLKQIISTDPKLNTTLSHEMKDLLQGMSLNDLGVKGKPVPIDQQMKDFMSTPEGKRPASVKAFIQSKADIISNPNVPLEMKKTAADNLYGDPDNLKFLNKFKDSSKQEVFQSLSSPSITTEMKKLGGKQWENYANWSKNAFIDVFKSAAVKVGVAPDSPFWEVKFNENSNRFEIIPTDAGIRFANSKGSLLKSYSVIEKITRLTGSDVKTAIDTVNRSIDVVEPILKESGYNTSQEVKNLTNYLSKYDKEHPTFWQWMLEGATKGVNPKGFTDHHTKLEDQTFGGVHPNFTQASGGEGSRGLVSLVEEYGPTHTSNRLMDMITEGESGRNYNRLVDTVTHPKEIPLTTMTVGEVLAYQKGMIKAGNSSSAAGKYQIVGTTLRGLVKQGHVSLEDKFDEKTQDKLAQILLEGRGYQDYLDGKKSLNSFMKDLGEEWEIVKLDRRLARKVAEELRNMKEAKDDGKSEDKPKEEPKKVEAAKTEPKKASEAIRTVTDPVSKEKVKVLPSGALALDKDNTKIETISEEEVKKNLTPEQQKAVDYAKYEAEAEAKRRDFAKEQNTITAKELEKK